MAAVKICENCGSPIKKLKHSILCQCNHKILTGHPVQKKQ
ncbi:hypothetical protein SAMN05443252_11055 [Bacillus sp. OV322]|jgi:DNA-directed RNA polymerase subunit RPC12/RpoP|nr:hypothetical protein SAMN05443252_11055 [Bacillus sp. OV322]